MSTPREQLADAGLVAPEADVEPHVVRRATKPKPTHYKVVCISLYTADIEQLDAKVDELKARGLTKANRSWLIRHALRHVDLTKCVREHDERGP
jgi:predicted transcriptional regulator